MSLFDAGQADSALTLTDLLAVEDTYDLLALRCPETGIPIWSVLRVAFLRQIMADLLFATGSINPPGQRSSAKAAITFARSVLHNERALLGRQLRSDVLLHTEAIGDELRDGRWFNRYIDPFGDLPTGQATVLTNMFEWQWRVPRYNERVFYHEPLQVDAILSAKIRRKPASLQLAKAATALVCDRAKDLLSWEMTADRRRDFVAWAAGKIAGLPFRYRAYRRLLRRVRPQFMLGLGSCYGTHAPLLAAAHDCGVITGEYQHGAISAGHDAYNFAPAVIDSEAYRRTLPQYLLTYGAWWGTQISAPVECVAIGSPTRERKLEGLAVSPGERRTILILADGIEFDLYLQLARDIAARTAGANLDVVLRPHPQERTSVVERYGTTIDGVRLDIAPDIYTSFMEAHAVVSELSTGLFEAVGLVDRIVLLNTAKARFAYPEHPFVTADSANEAADLIVDGTAGATKMGVEELWMSGWRERYRSFLATKIGIVA